MYQLKDYQQEAFERCLVAINNDRGPAIVQMPTGTGKTVLFAFLIKRWLSEGHRVLVLAHRKELLEQGKEKIVEIAQLHAEQVDIVRQSMPNKDAQVWIASVLSCSEKRMAMMSPTIIVIDECHHSIAASYIKVIEYYPKCKVLGFTATPTRMTKREKRELAQLFTGGIIYQMTVKQAILNKYLSRIEYYQVRTNVDLSNVRITSGGDFNERELEAMVNAQARNEACVKKYLELGSGKGMVFCVDVEHIMAVTEEFEKQNIEAYAVYGDMPDKEREAHIRRLKSANIKENVVVVACMVTTEGLDCPDLRMVILARPTRSPLVYGQQFGRVTRLHPDKECGIVVDMVDICKKRGMCRLLTTMFSLNCHAADKIQGDVMEVLNPGVPERMEVGEKIEAPRFVIQEDVDIQLANILYDMPEELEGSKLAWYSPDEKRYYVQIDNGKCFYIEDDMLKYVLHATNQATRETYRIAESCDVADLEKIARERCEKDFQSTFYMWNKKIRQDWSNVPATPKQAAWIKNHVPHIDVSKISKATASSIISAIKVQQESGRIERRQICMTPLQKTEPVNMVTNAAKNCKENQLFFDFSLAMPE